MGISVFRKEWDAEIAKDGVVAANNAQAILQKVIAAGEACTPQTALDMRDVFDGTRATESRTFNDWRQSKRELKYAVDQYEKRSCGASTNEDCLNLDNKIVALEGVVMAQDNTYQRAKTNTDSAKSISEAFNDHCLTPFARWLQKWIGE